ncbi:hypothetical protein [Streptomyces sp. NPDC059278]|uniref:hypothetical protein n=1 Tax=Streptomyces sp. NPDC059278 TaxID=3346801 RepID=UPI00369ED5E3
MRELERFFDDCDETTADAVAEFFDLHPAAEAYSAAIRHHADTLEAALATDPTDGTDPQARHLRGLPQPGVYS